MKRLSKVMKARQNESGGGGGEVKMELGVKAGVSMHVDAKTGRRYSYDASTGQTQWLSDKEETTIEEQGEKKQESSKRHSFRKIVGGDNVVFFQNIETEETVWEVPKNGDLVEL